MAIFHWKANHHRKKPKLCRINITVLFESAIFYIKRSIFNNQHYQEEGPGWNEMATAGKNFLQKCISQLKQLLKNNQSPKGKWLFVHKFAYINLKLTALNTLDRNFKPNNLTTIAVAFVFIDYFVLSVENFYRFRDDIWTAIQPICILAIIIPVRI